ncbi:MFS transporter [Streptomyces jumonjinensis]|uniref:MFS transporter n=1 Tax=Streptomyces jumonjinensis TaxID=1945 RepID=UPI003787B2F1
MTTEAEAQAPARVPPPPDREGEAGRSWAALAILLVGTFVTVLDYFIANVAIPSVQSDLNATAAQGQLVVIGYGVAFTCGMITGGRVGDLYGRRKMFALGMVFFTIASAACGFAPNADFLIVARVVQGAAAALMVPQVLGILGVVYTGAARVRAFTVYGLVVGFAAVFGQVIGGLLITVDIAGLDWRTIFLINIPIGVVTLWLTPRKVPESRSDDRRGLDIPGALLVTAALVALVVGLVEGQSAGWPVWSLVCLAATVPLFAAFVSHTRRRARTGSGPLIEPALFHNRVFSQGLVASLSYFLAMGSFFLLLALFLQQGRGLSPLESGLLFFTLGAGYFGSSMVSAQLAPKIGRRLVAVGPALLATGYVIVGLTAHAQGSDGSVLLLIPGLLVAGFGMGMTTGPLTGVVLSGAAPEHAAAASGVVNTVQEGGAAIGVAVVGAVFFPVLGDNPPASEYPYAFGMALIPLVVFALIASALSVTLPKEKQSG